MKKYLQLLFTTFIFIFLMNASAFAVETVAAPSGKETAYPIKYICDSIGGDISWNAKAKTVTVKYNRNTLQLKIGSEVIILNGKTKVLPEKITTAAGRTLVPISVINSGLGIELSEEDCLKLIGVRFIQLLQDGGINEASGLLSNTFSKYVNHENLDSISESISEIQFDNKNISLTRNTVHQNLSIPFKMQQADYSYIIRFDYDGRIDELAVSLKSEAEKPETGYSMPGYGTDGGFEEREVTIGTGVWKLPGTLTIPRGDGPFPVVILVQGSGPMDRDETSGALKPFRDLAVGLSSRKIAVLRYDKRSLEHSTKVSLIGNITMNEETEQDVHAAAEYLKTVKEVDASNIIVLGHGLGGYALPEIMTRGKDTFKAGIAMGGGTRPIYEMYAGQLEYLVSKGLAGQKQLDYIKSQADILNSPGFNPKTPPEDYTLGNEYYYYYMKTYDFKGLAGAIRKPLLVLQGERDYQTVSGIDFNNWKEALKNNSQAEFKLYPKLNHMFTEGEGDSTPAEYSSPSNIPEYVIDDIAEFIGKLAFDYP